MALAIWMHDFVADGLGVKNAKVIYLFETDPDWEALAKIASESADVAKWKKDGRRAERAGTRRLKQIENETEGYSPEIRLRT